MSRGYIVKNVYREGVFLQKKFFKYIYQIHTLTEKHWIPAQNKQRKIMHINDN